MKKRHKRLGFIVFGLLAIGVATMLVLNAFRENLVFYFSPSQVVAKEAPVNRTFRIGGLVETGSLKREADGLTLRFMVTDTVRSIPVIYKGILPDLFKEGRGCVAQGRIGPDGAFQADQVLARHDENYMPPDVAQSLEKATRSANDAAKTLANQ
jgi:cytochrome c-type biogenesis protein CcmE